MLFFFTLGSSMVGDICDEDDLNTRHRKEGSFYSVFWWFIKMGFALASFVAGILIEFTKFDQTQVTKVDYLEGSINEIKVNLSKTNVLGFNDYLKKKKEQNSETLNNAIKYDAYLERISQQNMIDIDSTGIQAKKTLRQNLKNTIDSFMYFDTILNPKKTDSIYLSTLANKIAKQSMNFSLIKAQNNIYELQDHFKANLKNKADGKHYSDLLAEVAQINQMLKSINIYETDSITTLKLEGIGKNIPSLKRQSPYTLLMMRVVEIGLPVIMSILSLIFLLAYNLTEIRLQEIKQALTARNS